jgi:predicted RNA-binding Zn-ribbon protein involved in translation (DUF1610 family)
MGGPDRDDFDDQELDEDEKDVCFACGMELSSDETMCPSCGWSR